MVATSQIIAPFTLTSYYCQKGLLSSFITRCGWCKCKFWNHDFGWASCYFDWRLFQKFDIAKKIMKGAFLLFKLIPRSRARKKYCEEQKHIGISYNLIPEWWWKRVLEFWKDNGRSYWKDWICHYEIYQRWLWLAFVFITYALFIEIILTWSELKNWINGSQTSPSIISTQGHFHVTKQFIKELHQPQHLEKEGGEKDNVETIEENEKLKEHQNQRRTKKSKF